jgi:hypothetical protein
MVTKFLTLGKFADFAELKAGKYRPDVVVG